MKRAVCKKDHIKVGRVLKLPPDLSDIAKFRCDDKYAWNRRRFIYPASGILYKNHFALIRAVHILQKRGYRDFEVIFTIKEDELADRSVLIQKNREASPNGSGKPKKACGKFQSGVDNLIFAGAVSRDKLIELYQTSTLVFPSYIETFGFPLSEARALGGLILSSDTPFSREALQGYDNAHFFNPFEPREIANLMQAVLDGRIVKQKAAATLKSTSVSSWVRLIRALEKL